jgi:hypothetical protein
VGAVRSQIITLMAPEDEAEFLRFVFERPTVYAIPNVRNPTADVPRTRDAGALKDTQCMLWDTAILRRPKVKYIAAAKDYYLESDESLIQFLRSPVKNGSITTGRIAVAATAPAMVAWYKALVRWIKAHFTNNFVYTSDFKPEVGSRERMVWAGRHAIALAAEGVKLRHNGPPEFSLHHFEDGDERRATTGLRQPRNLIAIGRVVHAGEVVSVQLSKRRYRVRFDADAPFRDFEGPFMAFHPAPRLDDEVACVFNENIFGRHADPWEPREIKKLTPANRARTLASLKKAWRT